MNTQNEQYRYGVVPEREVNVQKVTLVFNKLNGAFLNANNVPFKLADQSDPYCIYIEDKMDLAHQVLEGNLIIKPDGSWEKNYKIIDQSEAKEVIYEDQLKNLVANKITTKYKIVDQINLLSEAVMRIAEKTGVDLPELKECLDFIALVKETNEAHKEFYSESEDVVYISSEEALEESIKRFEGGLHEVMGGQLKSGGKVF